MISTRGRYAVRIMLYLAEHGKDGSYIPMREAAGREGISLKYMERILPELTKNGLVEGLQGKGGGYRLLKSPSEYTIGEILHAVEGDMAPVSCLEQGRTPCERCSECRTLPMWRRYQELTDSFFDSISLKDLLDGYEN